MRANLSQSFGQWRGVKQNRRQTKKRLLWLTENGFPVFLWPNPRTFLHPSFHSFLLTESPVQATSTSTRIIFVSLLTRCVASHSSFLGCCVVSTQLNYLLSDKTRNDRGLLSRLGQRISTARQVVDSANEQRSLVSVLKGGYCCESIEVRTFPIQISKGGSLNDFSAKEKSSINRLIKNLNRQRTVTIAETNEIVVKIDATLLILYQAKRKQIKRTAFLSFSATNSDLETLPSFSYKVY